ncbi:MAG: tetratricopeptide repeat protein, partial [Desulfatiglandales bacterium]
MAGPMDAEKFIQLQKLNLALNPECATSSYNLGVALLNQGRLMEAKKAFEDAVENSGRMFEGFVNLGYIYFRLGDLEKVVEMNKRAVELEPRYARGYANMGFAYLQMQNPEEAISALKRAIELNPRI